MKDLMLAFIWNYLLILKGRLKNLDKVSVFMTDFGSAIFILKFKVRVSGETVEFDLSFPNSGVPEVIYSLKSIKKFSS